MGILQDSLYGLEERLELRAVERGVQRYRKDRAEAEGRGDGAALSPARRLLMGWFVSLRDAIAAEQDAVAAGKPGPQRTIYGLAIQELPADKLAVITMHYAMGSCLRRPRGVRVPGLVEGCGRAVNAEVNLPRIRRNKEAYFALIHRRRRAGPEIVQTIAREYLDRPTWGRRAHIHLGVCLVRLLMETCFDDRSPAQPAFVRRLIRRGRRTPGFLCLSEYMFDEVQKGHHWRELREPVYQPMVCPPMPWTEETPGGYLRQRIPLITKLHATPSKPSKQAEWLTSGNMVGVFAALNALQSTPWRINKRILAVMEDLWAAGGNFGRIPRRDPYEKPPIPSDFHTNEESKKAWKVEAVKVYRKNASRLAEAVNFDTKLDVARRFADHEAIYFPHILDFRGRTYSAPLHLNHQSDDVCRGLLEFSEGKPLTDDGLRWLMIHIANCAGIDGVSYEDRVRWVLDNEATIRSWAKEPLENTGWLEFEKPFQLLAGAMAWADGGDCHIPVQLDASNNGLQHYAAILRDPATAALVNLVDSDQPGDLYAHVAAIVGRQVAVYAGFGQPEAEVLEGFVTRKLIKQTVMTTLYGVTEVGARRQIQAKLAAAGVQIDPNDPERTPWHVGQYLAGVVLDIMPSVCPAAAKMMDWLADVARRIVNSRRTVRWVSPIGLPVLQPYFRRSKHRISTLLQSLSVSTDVEGRGPMVRRQVQGFAPNWIHSIDAAHMLNVAIAAEAHGIRLAAVHDSFWTHAGNATKLSQIVRDEFVAMHSRPLGEELAEQLVADYPKVQFPPLPPTGDFDLQQTRKARYFVS